MEIRKFVIAVVSTFDARGNKAASKSMDALIKQSADLTKQYLALDRAQEAAASSAKKLAKGTDDVDEEMAGLQREISRLDDKIEKLNSTIGKSRKQLDALGKRSLKQNLGASLKTMSSKMDKFRSTMAPIGAAAQTAARGLAAFTAAGLAVGIGVLKIGTEFESLRARLKTVEGSVEGASRAFATIQKFAATTPFQIDNLTQGFTQLRVRGVKPTTDVLTGLGDLTSAFGLTFTDVTDAIGSAARGELDPIEKFGISAKIAGDQIKLSFKGQTVEVERSAAAVTDALVAFGKMEGIQGAMADQSATAGGMISNLKDAFSTLLDEIAQLGVLDEFKGLLGDISGLAGTKGLAGIVAEGLVVALQSLREWLANVSEQDIQEFLESVVGLVTSLADAFGVLIGVMKAVVDASGDAGTGMTNLALILGAMSVAMSGPGGLIVALGLAAKAFGTMAGAAWNSSKAMSTVNKVVLADLQNQVAELEALNNRTDALLASIAAGDKKFEEDMEDIRTKSRGAVKAFTGPLGAGLTKTVADEDVGRVAQQLRVGGKEREAGLGASLTTEGRQVLEGVEAAGRAQVSKAVDRARRGARRRGATSESIERTAENARVAAQSKVRSTRTNALTEANVAFQETGSVDLAVGAAAKKFRGKKRGGKGKGGGGFFDFEDKVKKAARSQAETFAAQELERLKAEGVATRDAIDQSRESGRKRAELLTEKFLEAGKIFEPGKEDNILDILGLKGAGSVLAGRPAPENLMINNVFTFNAIAGDFNQTVTVEGPGAVEDATSLASQTIVEQAFVPNMQTIIDLIDQQQRLQGDRMISAAGGGTSTQGPPG